MMKKNYVKAASLIETVLAISIITLCSLIGTMVYGTVVKTTPPIVRYHYEASIEANLEEIVTGNSTNYKKEISAAFSIEKRDIFTHALQNVPGVEVIVRTPYDTLRTPIYMYKKSQ